MRPEALHLARLQSLQGAWVAASAQDSRGASEVLAVMNGAAQRVMGEGGAPARSQAACRVLYR